MSNARPVSLRVAAFTQGRDNPNSRFRVRQYVSALGELGVELKELVAPVNSIPPPTRWLRPMWGGVALLSNLPRIAASWAYDVSLIQREFLSTLPTLEPLTKRPRLLDVDDAIFVYRGGLAARKLAQWCDGVICGNSYLADWFSKWNRHVAIVPTAVDTERFIPGQRRNAVEGLVIGWIGMAANFRYLASIEGALARALGSHPRARLRVVADRPPSLTRLPTSSVDWVRWTECGEVAAIQSMDIGLMPLDDTTWTRGKCSYKMLQYMACELPVVVSPVGMNADVLALGEAGFAAKSEGEWVESLKMLMENPDLRRRQGSMGRAVVVSKFSVRAVAPQLEQSLRGAAAA